VGDALYPAHLLKEGQPQKDIWLLWTTLRSGLTPPSTIWRVCESEIEAHEFMRKHPVGSVILEVSAQHSVWHDWVRDVIDTGFPIGIAAGDGDSPLAFDTLTDAGIYEQRYGNKLSKEIIDFLGEIRISELRDRFLDKWEIAAAFEYCFSNLPHSSAAYVAAHYQYHYYITMDDFSAGYIWRDLEILTDGVETLAVKAIETRQKAGQAGSVKSAEARGARRAALLVEMEGLVRRNPDIVPIGDEQIAKLAVTKAKEANPALWRQGQGQVSEYIGELRRGEAGPEMQGRYQALFGSKPPKRSR
jgi:hypothetical protein